MRRDLIVLFALAAHATGCSSSTEGPSPAPAAPAPAIDTTAALPANLAKVACRFAVPTTPEGSAYQCFDLAVPENRSVPSTRTIQVHVIAFRGKPGGTPTFELNGGPGGPSEGLAVALALGAPEAKSSVGRFLELGDYVLIDQRGTGRSIPRLACTENEMMMGGITAGKNCSLRHTKAGVDLTGYVTSENAEDVHDLKVALGAAKVNLHSISYGTRLALEVMRRHPDDVKSAIIDGVLPAQAKALTEGDLNNDKILSHIFETCAADAKCNEAYPNLEQALVDVKTKLDAHPFAIEGQPFGWEDFAGELLQSLSGDYAASEVPFRIFDMLHKTDAEFDAETKARLADDDAAMAAHDAELAKTDLGREVLQRVKSDPDPTAGGMADAMYLSVVCSDYVQYESLEEALALEEKVRPVFQSNDRVTGTWDVCAPWPKRAKAPDVWAAVASDVPVLAVAGAFDPLTPIAWRDLATTTLAKSQKVTMNAGAHGALDACAMGIKVAFLGESAIDPACAGSERVEFRLPGAPPQKLRPRRILTSPSSRVVLDRTEPLSPLAIMARWRTRARGDQ